MVHEIVRAQLRTGSGDGHAAAAALRTMEQWRARNPHRVAPVPHMLSSLLSELSALACAPSAGGAARRSRARGDAPSSTSLWFGNTRAGHDGGAASPRSMAEGRENLLAAVGVWREMEASALSATPASTAAYLRALAHHRRWDILHACRVVRPSTRRVVPELLGCFAKIGPRARTAVASLRAQLRKRGGFGRDPLPRRTASALADAMVACIGVQPATATVQAWSAARRRAARPRLADERVYCSVLGAISDRADLRDAFGVIEAMVAAGIAPRDATRRALTELVGRIGTTGTAHTSVSAEVSAFRAVRASTSPILQRAVLCSPRPPLSPSLPPHPRTLQTGQELAALWFGGEAAAGESGTSVERDATETLPPSMLFRHICEQAVDMALHPGADGSAGGHLASVLDAAAPHRVGEAAAGADALALHLDAVSEFVELALDEFNPYTVGWSAASADTAASDEGTGEPGA